MSKKHITPPPFNTSGRFQVKTGLSESIFFMCLYKQVKH